MHDNNLDPVMAKVLKIWTRSRAKGETYKGLGLKMGYPEETARQSATQFLQSHDPRISSLRRFAKAMGLKLQDIAAA